MLAWLGDFARYNALFRWAEPAVNMEDMTHQPYDVLYSYCIIEFVVHSLYVRTIVLYMCTLP